jgi:hypothetical protein
MERIGMTKDEALDKALEALEKLTDTEQTYEALDLGDEAITAIKQARAAQPAPGMAVQALAGEIIEALLADEKDGGYDLTAGMFGPAFSKLVRRWANAEWATTPPAQPAPVAEGVKLMQMLDALVKKYSDQLYEGKGAKVANDFELDVAAIRLTVAAQPAPVQEPVARIDALADNDCAYAYADGWNACVEHHKTIAKATPPAQPAPVQECFWKREGYKECPAAQRQWVGLTDEERWVIFEKNQTTNSVINAIEAKLKEKNT